MGLVHYHKPWLTSPAAYLIIQRPITSKLHQRDNKCPN
ncbi:hypothetical protein LCGC14_0449330 [marine sediment metagenome]|uniref:Uncharacterized protein n=1 Tax=marine sediment metagenome TaxID=412755 RepID=A0A0F9V523_9ZZZZ